LKGIRFALSDAVSLSTKRGLANGYFDMVGRVQRAVIYKDRGEVSKRFKSFLGDFEPQYVYCSANKEAEMRSVAKYDRCQPVLDQARWKRADLWAARHFAGMRGAGQMNYDQVVEYMDKSTSPGYPWSLVYASKIAVLSEPEFRVWLENLRVAMSEECETPDYVPFWTDSVKAEMREKQKALLNKLRTFCASPIELTMISNMLNLDMNQRFYDMGSKCQTWSAVGMSKYNCGWDRLARRLSRHPNGFALDVSSFDASVFRQSLYEIAEFRIECGNYKDQDATLMRNVYHHYVNSTMVLTNGDVVRKETGGPSGSGNTVVDNTLHLFKVLAYCWQVLAPIGMGYDSFMENVEAALYGDDNTFTCSDAVVSWFNAKTIAEVAKTIGVEITAEDDIWTPRPLGELKFLAQGFKFIEDTWWVPVPNTNKVLSSMLGAGKCHDVRWDLLRASALLMDSWWNEEVRLILTNYIHHLFSAHQSELVEGEVYKGVNYSEIKGVLKNEKTIRALYLCPESTTVPAVNGDLADPFNFVALKKC
jgi:hypothetical protein